MEMNKNNLSISLDEQLASIIALTYVNESEKLLGGATRVGKDGIAIKVNVLDDKVVYTLGGSLGDKLNNPDITFMYNEHLSKDDLPSVDKLTDMVYKNYITLCLMRYTIE